MTVAASRRPRAAVVGVGFIGAAHVEALRRIGVPVVGVCGSSPERTREQASRLGVDRVYAELAQLLDDPSVDVVHIATPNALHYEQTMAALDVGKHVVCEKPLALTADEAEEMTARAAEAGVVTAVCFNLRFYPLCQQMHVMVAAGAIGEPTLVSGSYMQDWLLLDTDWNWRLQPEAAGELRAVADIGSHWLDLAQFVVGRPVVSVLADLHTTVPKRRHPTSAVQTFAAVDENADLVEEQMTSDDAAGLLLRFAEGTAGVLTVSQVSAGRRNALSIEVDGRDASLSWHSQDPDRLWHGHRGRPNEVLLRDPALLDPQIRHVAGYPGGHVEGYPDTFRALFAEVYADVSRGAPADRPAYATFADGLDAMRVLDAVATSARTEQWTDVRR